MKGHTVHPTRKKGIVLGIASVFATAAVIVAVVWSIASTSSDAGGSAAGSLTEVGSISEDVDTAIAALVDDGDIPSLAAAIVVEDDIVWARGYGEQAFLDVVYMAGSIDKAFIATAVLQLVEQGLIDLDADVGDYLPFEVRNPEYPDTVVTVEKLLLHRAGLVTDLPDNIWYDNDVVLLEWGSEHFGWDVSENPYRDGRPPLDAYLASYFASNGVNRDAEIWIGEPGTTWQYSNIGFHLLLSYLVEVVTDQEFAAYVARNIFQPLGMENSSYEASDFPNDRLAVPYTRLDDGNLALPPTGMRGSRALRTTATDLARFLAAHMNDGQAESARILQPESARLMHSVAFPLTGHDWGQLNLRGGGLGWWLWTEGRSGHGGNVPGFSARIIMQETDLGTVGIVTMMNVGCSLQCDQAWYDSHFVAIRELLLEEARDLLQENGGH
jgi:CubicO group peptidase (beta-lactamase class C family)